MNTAFEQFKESEYMTWANVITATTERGCFTVKDHWGAPQKSTSWLKANPRARLDFYEDAERKVRVTEETIAARRAKMAEQEPEPTRRCVKCGGLLSGHYERSLAGCSTCGRPR